MGRVVGLCFVADVGVAAVVWRAAVTFLPFMGPTSSSKNCGHEAAHHGEQDRHADDGRTAGGQCGRSRPFVMLFHLESLRTCVIRCISPVHVVRRLSTEVITPSLVFNANSSRGGGQEYAGNRVRVAKILK